MESIDPALFLYLFISYVIAFAGYAFYSWVVVRSFVRHPRLLTFYILYRDMRLVYAEVAVHISLISYASSMVAMKDAICCTSHPYQRTYELVFYV